jgi:Cullin protein neddylation domain
MAFLEDTEPVLKNIEIERGTTIDAAVVRIMKTRKICSHVQLVGDILQHLSSFVPDPKLVKQRIEMLIEKEYLKRDIGDNKTYHYMP